MEPVKNDATATTATAPTSEKLTALKAAYVTAWQAMLGMTDPFAKETKDAKLAVWKIEGEIKAEEAAIQKLANDAKTEELRNARIQLRVAYKAAVLANTGKSANAETQAAEDAAAEVIDNELIAKFAHSRPAKVASEGGDKTASNANTAAIVELYLAGKTHKEIEEAGYKRSTVWHAINNYKKANEPAK